MFRPLAIIAVLFVVTPAAAQGWASLVEPLGKTVLRLEVGDGRQGGGCSGSVIDADKGHVLTAAHCVPTDLEQFSLTVDGRDARVLRVNRILDLAVLKSRLRRGATAITLAPAMPRAGDAVAVIGYPFGARTLTTQVGTLANPDVEGWAWVNADLLPGDSGGAIVDAQGRLVGVTSGFLYYAAAHIGLAVPLETVRAFVEEFLPGPK